MKCRVCDSNDLLPAIDLGLQPWCNNFLSKNQNSYSMIILNTCPFALMPYEVIYKLLVENGLMVFSAYPSNIKDTQYKYKLYIPPADRFSNITTEDIDAVMYKKIIPTQTAGKLSKKNKSRKKKNNKSKKKKNIKKNKNKNKNKKRRNTKIK